MRLRGRPKKYRIVKVDPKINQFSPRGRPGRPDEVELKMDEFEALRLADYRGLSQKEAAKSMHISQQTFSRILNKARQLIAKGITTGSAIKIQGGNYVISSRIDPIQNPEIKPKTEDLVLKNLPK
ncbi:MAG: DNA-binding protein [Candidatus Omnitrophica bacterium CG11_big_fil_rev_8_21_14_0_20_41_12]|nr:MAG: DNA-binding protein [Candidatus Omnitrophica bacterium CG11_big_fil_rev_8_21_14_0_20_41_12]